MKLPLALAPNVYSECTAMVYSIILMYEFSLLSSLINRSHSHLPNLLLDSLKIILEGALNTQNKEVMCVTLKIIQQMVMASDDRVGPGLVPFYRQLLPMFNAYKSFEGTSEQRN